MMALRGGISLLVAVLVANLSGTFATSFCREQPSPSVFNVNIFEEVISNHTDILETLEPAPFVRGAEENTPMYVFRGDGFLLNDNGLSSAIRSGSCSTNEVTLYASVFFVDSHSGGPVLQIFNGNDATARLPLFGMYMDALSDEMTLAYRHAGEPRLVSLGVRLHGGRWGRYAIVLSGNLMKVYVNCQEILSQIIPLPDYCANYPSLVVAVAKSADREHDEFTTGIYGYLQNVGFQFGHGGILRQCQQIGDVCPTCGQFLNLVQRVHELRQEVNQLNLRVEELETGTGSLPGMTTEPPTPSTGRSCLIEGATVVHGSFHTSNRRVCFCLNGNPSCTEVSAEDCEQDGDSGDSGRTPTAPPTGNTIRTPEPSTSSPSPDTPMCTIVDLANLMVPVGEVAYKFEDDDTCTVFFCGRNALGLTVARPETFMCLDNYTTCRSDFDPFQQGIAQCCRDCNVCDFVTDCPDNSECMLQGEGYVCQCMAGYEMQGDLCIDRNECELGLQQGGHNCPTNSECRNTPGSFECDCDDGYVMTINTNGVRRCVDVDECALQIDNCPSNSVCMNTPGNYTCMCDDGHVMVDGECRPVCDPPCENGGECIEPDVCMCHRGYTGDNCESDIDECALGLNSCNHPESRCINTPGGYFCQCNPGFQGNGSFCEDINECATRIHNCIRGVATCVNAIGSFFCMCTDDRGRPFDCSGACLSRTSVLLMNGQSEYDRDRCRNCTCLEGELMCGPPDCDCSRVQSSDRNCCPGCFRSNCVHSPSGTLIRPGNTWTNPENRCERFTCTSRNMNLVLDREDLASQCPPLACSEDDFYTPVGRCCPICRLPPCTPENRGEVMSLRNGCKRCTCDGAMTWQCTERSCLSMETCAPERILFYEDGCCPVCEGEALGAQTCVTVS